MKENVKCKKCLNKWHETKIKTSPLRITDQAERIAYYGGNGWREIKCKENKCKGVVVRLELTGKIQDSQLNAVTTQRKEYIKK